MRDLADLRQAKAELRKRVLARRDALSVASRDALSEAIFARVTALDGFREAGTVLAYSSFGSEPDTATFIGTVLQLGKVLALPRVRRETRMLELYRVDEPERQLEPGLWGIREPAPARCPPVARATVDFVLVPGVAFDLRGGRIGYGGGYYDRLLAACAARTMLVAGAFETQLVGEVPMGPGDHRVDLVVTEQGDWWREGGMATCRST